MLEKGAIVLVPFPFTDLSQTKLRPAIVLYSEADGQDVTLCFVSSQQISVLGPGEFVLVPGDPDFALTQLKVASKVRTSRIATLERRLIPRRLGRLGPGYLQQLDRALILVFQLQQGAGDGPTPE